WAQGLMTALEQFENAAIRHRDLAEAPGGTLDQIAGEKPQLLRKVERQRAEHAPLLDEIAGARAMVRERFGSGEGPVEATAQEVRRVNADVQGHLNRAVDLLYEAFFRDDGGEA